MSGSQSATIRLDRNVVVSKIRPIDRPTDRDRTKSEQTAGPELSLVERTNTPAFPKGKDLRTRRVQHACSATAIFLRKSIYLSADRGARSLPIGRPS